MLDHINEHQLENLLLRPDDLDAEEKRRVETHLEECALCREQWSKLRAFYQDVQQELQALPTERDRAIAERLLGKKRRALPERSLVLADREGDIVDGYSEIIEPYRRPLAQRLLRYVRMHPVRFAGATSFAAAAVALSLFLARSPKDVNPTYVEVKKAVLSAFSKESQLLWTKSVVGIPEKTSHDPFDGLQRLISVDDVDGDGFNEILLSGSLSKGPFAADTLYCFNRDGELRWNAGVGTMISFGEKGIDQHSSSLITNFIVMKESPTTQPRLFVLARDNIFSPTKLFELDPLNGYELQSFFNRGHCGLLLHTDVDDDGKEEIILGGINDGFNRACLAVLDPSDISGYAPVPDSYLPLEGEKGREKYYVLFPFSDLGQVVSTIPYNSVIRIQAGEDKTNLVVSVSEVLAGVPPGQGAPVVYIFGPGMRIEQVIGGDGFSGTHARQVEQGKLLKPLTPEYWMELKNSVLYWDGEKFVKTPTMNKLYLASKTVL